MASEVLGWHHFPDLAAAPTSTAKWRHRKHRDAATPPSWRPLDQYAEVAVSEALGCHHLPEPAAPP
ncbi:hypothetical protein KBX03_19830, partial [Micromonospora sp. C72]|uniref:hypothetical protein n=1 Tax=Micromonospora sp. C72 TaxID=2824880 RepID=UPI001B361CA8